MPHGLGIVVRWQLIAARHARVLGCGAGFADSMSLVPVVPHALGIPLRRQCVAADSARVHLDFSGSIKTLFAYGWPLVFVVPHARRVPFRRQFVAADSARMLGLLGNFTSEAERASVSCFSWAVIYYANLYYNP